MVSKGQPEKDSARFFEICYLRLGEEHHQDVCCAIAFEWEGSFED
jgi:hypothetical protein